MKYLTFKNLLIAVCFVIIAILLFRGCGGKGERAKEAKRISDSVAKVYIERMSIMEAKEKSLQDSLNEAEVKREVIVQERNSVLERLKSASNKSATLSKLLADARENKDTVEYYTICDSLGNMVLVQGDLIKDLETYISQSDSLIIYETSIRDQVIELLQNKFVACDSAYKGEKRRFDKLYSDLRPRNKYYIGGEIIGGRETILAQAGGVISLNTKKDKLYQVSVGMASNGQPYLRLNANFKISFRK